MTTVMPEDQSRDEASRYPLPLYLNQKYVFDVLSMMERGFSQLETITSRRAGQVDAEGDLSREIGFGNVFGLLNVSLGGGQKPARALRRRARGLGRACSHSELALRADARAIA
jgi:hypothetical protein